jgi:hypothetical protein
MRYKTMLLLFCCSIFTIQLQSRTAKPGVAGEKQASQSVPQEVPPDHIIYEFLFRSVVNLESLAEQRDQAGKDTTAIRDKIRNDFALSDIQAQFLNSMAFDSMTRARQLDDQAHQIIYQARKLYPEGRPTGQQALQCPPMLYVLQAEPNNVFLAARLRLQQEFGDAAFVPLDNLLRQTFAKDIHKQQPHLSFHK